MPRFHDYIPHNDDALLQFAKTLYTYALTHYAAWSVPSPQTVLDGDIAAFEATLGVYRDPNHGRVDTLNKNEAKKTLIANLRVYIQGYVARNPKVPDEDRELMGLHLRDTTPTPVPAPTDQPEADITFPGIHLVELVNIRQTGQHATDTCAEYGTRIYWGLAGEPTARDKFRLSAPPLTGDDLPHSVFTRSRKRRFDFDGESGRTVYFCLRYENSKGETGPFGRAAAFTFSGKW